ncbi:hypothetical protein [Bradyrhizobium sp. SZCCHNS1054]|uniref:hypothetical protein n=1 Tax=Bradyrhizobium sp. SZCCHNS1054 TaxID=3057301 RepID=UPI0029168787|nr:hypothetical protein [Bradyrhizobium sp. SZCCHNS1054]
MTYVNVPVNAFRKFALERLCIVPDLVAAKHEFMFGGKKAIITLPPLEKESVPYEQRRIECRAWKTDWHVPIEYDVHSLDVEIEVEEPISVPEALRQLHPNQYELLQPPEREQLDKIVSETGAELHKAFAHWLRVLRWKSEIGYIGEPSISYAGGHQGGGGAVLRERSTGHRMWLQGQTVFAIGSRAVTVDQWQATQAALSSGKTPPVWFDFLFDAEMRINNNDLVGSVLSLAISFEVNVRFVFSRHLSMASIEPVIIEIFDQTNLRGLLNRLKRTRDWNDNWAAATDLSTLNSLMNRRDGVMHSAKVENLDPRELRKTLAAVKKFAYFTCDVLGLS